MPFGLAMSGTITVNQGQLNFGRFPLLILTLLLGHQVLPQVVAWIVGTFLMSIISSAIY